MDLLEKETVKSLKQGNKQTFEAIFNLYYARLCRYSYGIVKQREVAEDIVKDLFLKLWEDSDKLSINTSLFSYLVRAVHNASINYVTRVKNRKAYISEDEKARSLLDEAVYFQNPLSDILLNEIEEAVILAINELPEKCRTIFELSRHEGLSHKEIALQLNISENTVKVQIYNALSVLKNRLKPFLIFLLVFFNIFSK